MKEVLLSISVLCLAGCGVTNISNESQDSQSTGNIFYKPQFSSGVYELDKLPSGNYIDYDKDYHRNLTFKVTGSTEITHFKNIIEYDIQFIINDEGVNTITILNEHKELIIEYDPNTP